MKLIRLFLIGLLVLLLTCSVVTVFAAEEYPVLEITQKPDKLVYGLGDQFDKTGMKATIWDTANTGTAYYEDELTVTPSTLNTSGLQTVTVKCRGEDNKWYYDTLTVYVLPYTLTRQATKDYPYKTYYGNEVNDYQTYTCPGAQSLLIQFSDSTYVESCDYIYLYGADGALLGRYEDKELAGKKIWISGDSFAVRLTSDEDNDYRAYGYSITSIWSANVSSCPHLYGDETVTSATCDKDGSKVKECVGCGYVFREVLPKLTADGIHTYDYEQHPKESYHSGYYSYYDLYYECETCGYRNTASGYPGYSGNDANHGSCGQTVRWALLNDGTMVLYRMQDGMSYYVMNSIPRKAANTKALYVQNGITTIYPEAFMKAYSLTAVRFPASMEKIGESAFRECRDLTEMSFPGALATIGDNAFRGCTSLTSVDFGTSSPTVGQYAFAYCDALSSVDFGSGSVVLGYSSFDECPSIAELDIPAEVTLGTYSFHKCTGLTSVTVRCKEIPDSTFESCWSLSSVVLENTEEIGEYAFGGTNSLQSITFPATLKFIDRAFTGQAGHNPALRTATFLTKNIVFSEHPFPSVSTAQLTLRGPGCSTTAAFAQKHGYAFSATDTSSHTMEITPAVTPSCKQEGCTEGEFCTVCGYVAQKSIVLEKKEHQLGMWEKADSEMHSRSCMDCGGETETQAHTRTVGYCDICHDDVLEVVFSDGTLTVSCPQVGFEGLTVICGVYNSADQLLFCREAVWNAGTICTIDLPETTSAAYIKVYFLETYVPLRRFASVDWQ